jgi:hypothetical protein
MSTAHDSMHWIAGIVRWLTVASPRSTRIRVFLLCAAASLASGCIEIEQIIKIHDDATVSIKATIKVDPQFEALVMPQLKNDLPKKVPPGV